MPDFVSKEDAEELTISKNSNGDARIVMAYTRYCIPVAVQVLLT